MTQVLLDTHVWAWSLRDDHLISEKAASAISMADRIVVSPISFYEITLKVGLGKWPGMSGLAENLETLLVIQGGKIAALTPAITMRAGFMNWPHRDPFDRMIAATAIIMDLTLISADNIFDGLPLRRVW